MKKKYCIAFLTLALVGGILFSFVEISKTKGENQSARTESAPLKLEGVTQRQEYQNGITIEGEVWSREINASLETELKAEPEMQSDGQAGAPAK